LTIYAGDDHAQIYFSHALKAEEQGEMLRAESLLKKAIEIEPENPNFHFELGNLLIEKNDLMGARLEFEQAVMIDPEHLASHYNLGLVYGEFGLTAEAREEFRKVLELDPRHIKAELQIGYTYANEGFFDDAREAFRKAQEMDITDPEPRRAIEEVDEMEAEARLKSRSELRQAFEQRQFLLNRGMAQGFMDQPNQTSTAGKQALIQTGALLIQQWLTQRARARAETNPNEPN